MKNLFKKTVINSDEEVNVKLSLFELDLIRTTLLHSVATADWDLSMDKEAVTVMQKIVEHLSKYKKK